MTPGYVYIALGMFKLKSRPQPALLLSRTMSQVLCLHGHLANAARINSPVVGSGVVDCENILEYVLTYTPCGYTINIPTGGICQGG